MLPLIRLWLWALLLIAPTFWPTAAHAMDDVDLARGHMERGTRLFEMGDFATARVEFETAYQLSKEPQILFNIALAWEREGLPRDALGAYRRYLVVVPNDADTAAKVRKLEAQLGPVAVEKSVTASAGAQEPGRLAPKRKPAFIAGVVAIGVGAAVLVAGFGVLGATSALARNIESMPRTAAELNGVQEQRGAMETAGVVLLVVGAATLAGGGVVVGVVR